MINDFINMIELYRESGIKILSKNPFSTDNNSVKIMTAFTTNSTHPGFAGYTTLLAPTGA